MLRDAEKTLLTIQQLIFHVNSFEKLKHLIPALGKVATKTSWKITPEMLSPKLYIFGPRFVFKIKNAGYSGLAAQPSRPRPSSPARFKTENRYQNRLQPMFFRPPTTLPGRLGGVLRQLLQE